MSLREVEAKTSHVFASTRQAQCATNAAQENERKEKNDMEKKQTKKEYNRQRGKQIIIRFSEEELTEINQAIKESGLSKADFFLQVLRKKNIIIVSDLKEICFELKKQGINLNQALRHYHETKFTEEIEKAIRKCNDLYESAKNIFLESENRIQKVRRKKRERKEGED